MTLPRPNATRDLFPSRSFFLQRGALARVGGFIRRFYRAPVSRAGQNRSLRRVGLLVLDFDDFGVTANLAFERAQIVIRLGRGLDPRETCQTTALGTRRPVQLDCVDVVWLRGRMTHHLLGGREQLAIPIAAIPSKASDRSN